jgi:hypothetical protein
MTEAIAALTSASAIENGAAEARLSSSSRRLIPDFVAAAAVFSAVSLAVYLAIVGLDQRGMFRYWNIFFDSDPIRYVAAYAHGWDGGGVFRPWTKFIYALPVRGIEMLLGVLDLATPDVRLREQILFVLLGAQAGAAAVLSYAMARLCDVRIPFAALFAAVAACCFSNLVFFSVPESFGTAGLALAVMLVLALWIVRFPAAAPPKLALDAAGIFACGIAITNAVFFGLLFWAGCVARGMPLWKGFRIAVVRAAIVLTIASAIGFFAAGFLGTGSSARVVTPQEFFMAYWLRLEPTAAMLDFPRLLGLSLVGVYPGVAVNAVQLEGHPSLMLSYTASASVFPLLGWCTVFLAASGVAASWHRPERGIALACTAFIVWNWALHSVWSGGENFLYSQHWVSALLYLLLVALIAFAKHRLLIAAVSAIAIILAAWNVSLYLRVVDGIASDVIAGPPSQPIERP